jgi:hypothetical protein
MTSDGLRTKNDCWSERTFKHCGIGPENAERRDNRENSAHPAALWIQIDGRFFVESHSRILFVLRYGVTPAHYYFRMCAFGVAARDSCLAYLGYCNINRV